MDAIILAAGFGKRMQSDLPKALHQALDKPLAQWVIDAVSPLIHQLPVLVVGYKKELLVREFLGSVRFAVQKEQLGTGHAVLQARDYLEEMTGYVFVLAGDMPLLRTKTLERLAEAAKGKAGAVLSVVLENPYGYGRILRAEDGNVVGIVEEKDATEQQRKIKEVNTSVYCFDAKKLLRCLEQLTCDNAQGEYYLTDCVELLVKQGEELSVYVAEDPLEGMGVNDQQQLKECEAVLKARAEQG